MSVKVEINDNKFNKSKISINRGKHIRYKSTDGITYTVDCGKQNPDISDQFPFTIPGDNKFHKLKIKGKAKKQAYTCSIISKTEPDEKSSGSARQVKIMSAVMPTMIIEVG